MSQNQKIENKQEVQVKVTSEELNQDIDLYQNDEELQLYLKVVRGQKKYEVMVEKLKVLQGLEKPSSP